MSPLGEYFLDYYNKRYRKNAIKSFSEESLHLMHSYGWPGNVRELRNMVERLVVLKDPGIIEPRHLPLEIVGKAHPCPESVDLGHYILPPEGVDVENLGKIFLSRPWSRAVIARKRRQSSCA